MRNSRWSSSSLSSSRGRARPDRRGRVFQKSCIFQLLVMLIGSALLTSLWLMVRLEAIYDAHVAVRTDFEWADGQRSGRQPGRIASSSSSNGVWVYADERQLPQPVVQLLIEAKPSSNVVEYGPSPKSASNRNDIPNKRHSTKQYPGKESHFDEPVFMPSSSLLLPSLPLSLEYLGVMIDAGRHYFPLPWLYEQLKHIHNLGYNYIHFRLTDDQNFILDLEIPNDGNSKSSNNQATRTSLAFVARQEQELTHLLKYTTHRVNINKGSISEEEGSSRRLRYQAQELSKFVRYAKSTYNITVVPEINVPGHAGSWGANTAFPDLVVSCPQFACSKGYGVPLNLTHPALPRILKNVLAQVIDIFDHPPFLHLGGDELHMSRPCLEEAGIKNTSLWLMKGVERFEEDILKPIVEDLGYAPHQIIRWETKNQQQTPEAQPFRFGGITHYWESTPSPRNGKNSGIAPPYMVSTGLYLDVLGKNKGMYGYGEYQATQQLLSGLRSNPPLAIVAGTFELGTEFWDDRNVLGRLLAIRMGVAATTSTGMPGTQNDFKTQYTTKCKSIFSDSEFDSMCQSAGWPRLDDRSYQTKWKRVWKEWKNGVCDGLTYSEQSTHINPFGVNAALQRATNEYFWESVLSFGTNTRKQSTNLTVSKTTSNSLPNVGIVINLVQNYISPQGFFELLRMIKPLGINLIQLQLTDDLGQAVDYDSLPGTGYRLTQLETNQTPKRITDNLYNRIRLEQMVDWADQVGIQLVPEINLATNGGGWFKTGMLMDCPKVLCGKGRVISLDVIDKFNSVMPIALAAIAELRDIFSFSPLNQFFHLGFDERKLAVGGCFAEAAHNSSQGYDALHQFESKLSTDISLLGIDQKSIIRWRNDEKIDYEDRTGAITHYTDVNDLIDEVDRDSEPASVFGAIHITDEMTPWEVYRETQRWKGLSPALLGLVAKGSGGQIPRLDQLVAFVMALEDNTESEMHTISWDTFQTEFEVMCARVQCTNTTDHLGRANFNPSGSEDSHLTKICIERTTNITTRRSKAFLH